MSNNNKNKLVPRLRFPEFKNDWETEQLSNLLDYERPDNYIVKDTNYTSEGTPVLTANKSFILGYTQESFGICNDIPAIIFDDFTVDKKFVDFPFKVKSSAIKILRPKGKNDLKFLFELMSLIRFEAKEHKRYYISAYQNLTVPIPKPAEQQKIAACLSSLDDLITAESQKLELYQQHKKGLLQNLFPNCLNYDSHRLNDGQDSKNQGNQENHKNQGSDNVPKLRFPEFEDSGEWEETTLESVAEIKRGAASQHLNYVEKNHPNAIRLLRINDFLSDTPVYVEDTDDMKRFRVKTNDLLIAGTGATAGITFIVPEEFNDLAYSYNAPRIRIERVNCIFVYQYLKSDAILRQQKKLFVGNAQPFLDISAICSFKLYIPQQLEQQKIAACLSSLDDLINAQRQKIEWLQQHKKGLLQGLFPQCLDYDSTDLRDRHDSKNQGNQKNQKNHSTYNG